MPQINTSEPGWVVSQGQAVWRQKRDAPEIAGELLFAAHRDGRTFLQFTKTPLPFVTVQTSNELWQVEFVPQQRVFSGKGSPTARLIWVHLARALSGGAVQPPLKWRKSGTSHDEWSIENSASGELITGFIGQ